MSADLLVAILSQNRDAQNQRDNLHAQRLVCSAQRHKRFEFLGANDRLFEFAFSHLTKPHPVQYVRAQA